MKIYRDLINQPPFKNRPDIFLFYTWLLVNAPFHSNTLEVRCEELGKIFGKSRITIMNWLRELESEHLLYIKTYNKFTSVTIIPIEIDGNSETSTLHQLDIKVTSETLEPAPILSSEPLKNKEYKKKEVSEELIVALESEQKLLDDDKVDLKWVVENWNQIAESSDTMKVIRQIPERSERKRSVLSKKKEEWDKAFELIADSPFLLGQIEPSNGRKKFSLSIDWIIKPVNWNKLLEGNYNPKRNVIVKKERPGAAEVGPVFAGMGKSLIEIDAEMESRRKENGLETLDDWQPEYLEDDDDERF